MPYAIQLAFDARPMKNAYCVIFLTACFGALTSPACSSDESSGDPTPDSGLPGTSDRPDAQSSDLPDHPGGDGGINNTPDAQPIVCDEQDIAIELGGVKVMLLLDRSGSMLSDDKWEEATQAIQAMLADPANHSTMFGLQSFSAESNFAGDQCTSYELNETIAPATDNQNAIVSWLSDNPPDFDYFTPLVDALKYYVERGNTSLHDANTANYLVVISDGEDTCYEGDGRFTPQDELNTIAGVVNDIKNSSKIKTIAIGFGDSAPDGALTAIARNGGSSFDEFISAASGPQLEAALKEIAEAIRPCRYHLENPSVEADLGKVNFYLNGQIIPRDRSRQNGWNWTRDRRLEVEFYGAACSAIKTQTNAQVRASFGCPTQIGADGRFCAAKDYLLSMPEVAVMLLQDFSSSMNDGNKWQQATTAITEMLVDDKNDHVEFGLDVFPDVSGNDACGLDPYANVAVGKYNVLPIVEWISNNDPITPSGAATPLHDALERVSYRPDRIGEDDVSGALVVISDGGESCYNDSDISAALTTSTERLFNQHSVRTFAIGFGQAVNAEQLNAIARAGGTGFNQYIQADNQTELEEVFKRISSLVTSCVLKVPYAGTDVDYNLVNFVFDGTVIARDADHKYGWDWVNPVTKTEVEFFGPPCEQLQTGTITDVAVEFGCATNTEVPDL